MIYTREMKKKRLNKRNAIYTPESDTTSLINYSEDSEILEIEFTDGGVYHYKNVELDKWEEYKAWVEDGRLSGQFLTKYIKPFYLDVVQVE
jgi:hypothetical protein